MKMIALMLGVFCLALPVAADELYPNAAVPMPPLEETDTAPQLRAVLPPSGSTEEYIAPSKDVPLYVPLTDDQQELPTIAASEGEDYVPGIEQPSTPPAVKAITDRVP